MKKNTLSYVAGLFDGEGSIVIAVSKPSEKRQTISPSHWLQVSISMTHQPTIEWLHTNFGGHVTNNGKSESRGARRPCYAWRLEGNQAKDFLHKVTPYLICKREQALLAVEFQAKRQGNRNRLTDSIVQEREGYRSMLRSMTNGCLSPTGW